VNDDLSTTAGDPLLSLKKRKQKKNVSFAHKKKPILKARSVGLGHI